MRLILVKAGLKYVNNLRALYWRLVVGHGLQKKRVNQAIVGAKREILGRYLPSVPINEKDMACAS